MKIYTNTSFKGHYPVGAAAIVAAKSPEEAAEILNAELKTVGLEPTAKAEGMKLFTPTKDRVRILVDENY